jgi:hypothetical protein
MKSFKILKKKARGRNMSEGGVNRDCEYADLEEGLCTYVEEHGSIPRGKGGCFVCLVALYRGIYLCERCRRPLRRGELTMIGSKEKKFLCDSCARLL